MSANSILHMVGFPIRFYGKVLRNVIRAQNNGVSGPVAAARCMSSCNRLPTREEHLAALEKYEYDVLVIGGGATGAGCALDAASRGLRTALVDADDFASGTSSKSTKLLHGGVRYMQLGFRKLDLQQFKLVKEAIRERNTLMCIAPHLNRPVPIMVPAYRIWEKPLYWLGLKLYDLLSAGQVFRSAHMASREKVLCEFPLLREEGLRGAVVYCDGQFDDSRLCVTLALSAAQHGANIANHVEVIELLKQDGICRCAKVRDRLTGKKFYILAKSIINATGPHTDSLRQMEESEVKAISMPSRGTHIMLPDYFCSRKYGLINPHASEGRIIFMLPWNNHTLAGTTDEECAVSTSPKPTKEDIDFILDNLRGSLEDNVQLEGRHVRAAWTGIRPLVVDPENDDSCEFMRSHLIEISDGNMITVVGGKWTVYRTMAEQAVNVAIECGGLEPTNDCCTSELPLEGACDFTTNLPYDLMQNFDIPLDVALHLAECYGTNAYTLLLETPTAMHQRVKSDFPFIEAEIMYACKHEYACTAVDVIARRMRIAFVDAQAASEILPKVINVMKDAMDWKQAEVQKQIVLAQQFLAHQMGLGDTVTIRDNIMAHEVAVADNEAEDLVKPIATEDVKSSEQQNTEETRRAEHAEHIREANYVVEAEEAQSDEDKAKEIKNEVEEVELNSVVEPKEHEVRRYTVQRVVVRPRAAADATAADATPDNQSVQQRQMQASAGQKKRKSSAAFMPSSFSTSSSNATNTQELQTPGMPIPSTTPTKPPPPLPSLPPTRTPAPNAPPSPSTTPTPFNPPGPSMPTLPGSPMLPGLPAEGPMPMAPASPCTPPTMPPRSSSSTSTDTDTTAGETTTTTTESLDRSKTSKQTD